jgi:hypothetical protein
MSSSERIIVTAQTKASALPEVLTGLVWYTWCRAIARLARGSGRMLPGSGASAGPLLERS